MSSCFKLNVILFKGNTNFCAQQHKLDYLVYTKNNWNDSVQHCKYRVKHIACFYVSQTSAILLSIKMIWGLFKTELLSECKWAVGVAWGTLGDQWTQIMLHFSAVKCSEYFIYTLNLFKPFQFKTDTIWISLKQVNRFFFLSSKQKKNSPKPRRSLWTFHHQIRVQCLSSFYWENNSQRGRFVYRTELRVRGTFSRTSKCKCFPIKQIEIYKKFLGFHKDDTFLSTV